MTAEPSRESSRVRASLVLLAAFALGIVAGAALLHIVLRSLGPSPWGPPPGPRPPLPPVEHLGRELDLDAEQVGRLREILDDSRERMRGVADTTRERIREILTDEQRERFEALGPPPEHPLLPPRRPRGRPPGPRGRTD